MQPVLSYFHGKLHTPILKYDARPFLSVHALLELCAALAVLLVISDARSQSRKPLYVGAGAGGSINMHSLNREIYRGSEYCGVFKSGTSIEPWFSALVEFPFGQWGERLWFSPRLHFNNMGADITTAAVDNNVRVRDPRDSSLVDSDRDHHLDTRLIDLGIDIFAKYQIEPAVFVFAGPSVGFFVERSVDHREVIISPPGGMFTETGTPSRTLSQGDIEGAASMTAALTIGGGLDLDLASSIRITPELAYTYHFLPITSEHAWSVSQVKFGVHLKFNVAPEMPKRDTIVPPIVSTLAASVAITGLETNEQGIEREVEVPVVRVEEFVTREAYPILNSLFFAEGARELPSRYVSVREEGLTAEALSGASALDIHYRTLDILGSRLKSDPAERMIVRGFQTEREAASNSELALARAQHIANALTDRWGIAPARLSIEARTVASTASAQADEEQQRVELIPQHTQLLDPLIVERIERTTNPPKLRVRSAVTSNGRIASRLTVRQEPAFNQEFTNPSPVVDIAFRDDLLPTTDQPLIASLTAEDDLGGNTTARDTVQVQQITIRKKRLERQADVERERYNLITFELDKSLLDERSLRILTQIAQDVTSRDTIRIVGYTDLTGEAAHNRSLSVDRAEAVRKALANLTTSRAPSAVFQTEGAGEQALFDNTLPEGRQLSRTVQISVTRPVGIQ